MSTGMSTGPQDPREGKEMLLSINFQLQYKIESTHHEADGLNSFIKGRLVPHIIPSTPQGFPMCPQDLKALHSILISRQKVVLLFWQ